MNRAIVWFRQDLRLHDNEAITEALKFADAVLYVYVFEERFINGTGRYGFRRTGVHRLNFIIESVRNLRENLRSKGADLVIRCGRAEEEVFKIARKYKSSAVFCNRESTEDEVKIQDRLEQKLWTDRQEIRYFKGKMLFYTQDLPFPITHTPDQFKIFRKEVEKIVPIRDILPTPDDFKYFNDNIALGELPDIAYFGWGSLLRVPYSAFPFKGGETAGLDRLDYFLWRSNLCETYHETRLELSSTDNSSKLSAYLSLGCISPKKLFLEIERYEHHFGESKSTSELKLDLLWRDFLRLTAKKYKNSIFVQGGLRNGELKSTQHNSQVLYNWINGNTGEHYVDAIMKELNSTGYISFKCRQIASSFLIHELRQNWQAGAEYFESLLIDYDVCSNWCNWINMAGIGNFHKEKNVANLTSIPQKYDPDNVYLERWNQHKNLSKLHPGMLGGFQ